MTETLAKQFKDRFDRLALKPSSGGRFEVRIDGETVYSKLATGTFPEEEAIAEEVQRRLATMPEPGQRPAAAH